MKTKIALCQVKIEAKNLVKNFEYMEEIIRSLAKEKISLCIFPEDFLYGILRNRKEIREAGKNFNHIIGKIIELSKKYNIDIIPGTLPLYQNNQLYNTTIYINKAGKVLTRYSKNNLWISERNEYSPSLLTPKVFNSILGKTALIICWDIFDHHLFESVVKQQVEYIIVLSLWSINQSNDLLKERGRVPTKYSGYSDSKLIDTIVQARTAEYNVGIIFCNFARVHQYIDSNNIEDKCVSAGHSQIVIPFSKTLVKATNRNEQILICEMPKIENIMNDFETYYNRRNDVINSYPYYIK